ALCRTCAALSIMAAPCAVRGDSRATMKPSFLAAERWPSGRRRTPAKGVRVKSPSRVRIPLSPPVEIQNLVVLAAPIVQHECRDTDGRAGPRARRAAPSTPSVSARPRRARSGIPTTAGRVRARAAPHLRAIARHVLRLESRAERTNQGILRTRTNAEEGRP